MSDATKHGLYREVRHRYKEPMKVFDDGSVDLDMGAEPRLLASDIFKTIHCECGDSFRSEEKAIEHIQSVESKDE